MSDQVTTSFVRQFTDGMRLVAQQMISELRSKVTIEPVQGNVAYVDYIGVAPTPTAQASLIQATNLQEIPHSRRAIMGMPYPLAVPISKQALSRLKQDPTGTYVQTMRASFERLCDRMLMAAAIGTAISVSTEELTPANIILPVATQKVVESGTLGMTKSKIIAALTRFNLNHKDKSEKFLALSPQAIEDLMLDLDVNEVQAEALDLIRTGNLVSKPLWGFNVSMSTELPRSVAEGSPGIRSNVAWVKEGLCLGINEDITVDIGPRRDLNNLMQILMTVDQGATRMQETDVFEIQAYESY